MISNELDLDILNVFFLLFKYVYNLSTNQNYASEKHVNKLRQHTAQRALKGR